MWKLCLSFILINYVSSEKLRFDNYSLYRVEPRNDNEIKLLQDFQNDGFDLDFWTDPVPNVDFINIMTSPVINSSLNDFLSSSGINFEVTIENIQEAIDKESIKTYNRINRKMTWDAYYTLNDIETWMKDLAEANPSIVTKIIGGITYEGRQIKGLKISHGNAKQTIFIEAGIHSREWITMTTACYIINELLTSDHEETKAIAKEFDWYIFPVTNPDGYVWTHEQNRMWRKNRRPIGNSTGVDLNRNWNNNWMVIGASNNPVSETFAGTGPFSEPETRTLSEYIASIENIEIYLSLHSSGQLLMVPFGNTTDHLANYYDAVNIGRRAMGALSVRYGTQYTTGNIAEAIYHASGGSVDWVKETLRVPLTYCYELRDKGQFGHLLPADQILPNNQEVMDSIVELIVQGKRFGYFNKSSASKSSLVLISLLFAVIKSS